MSEFLQYLTVGLALGALYALTAHGLVLIYRASGVISFTQGAFGMVGAYLYYRGTQDRGWPVAVAWIVALGIPAAAGAATHLLVLSRLRRASSVVRLVTTLGIMFFLTAAGRHLWGDRFESVDSPLPSRLLHPFGGRSGITEDRVWLIVIALVITIVLFAAYRYTRFGHMTEAVAESPMAAGTLGISPDLVAAVNWALGSALAAVTGILIAPIVTLGVAALAFTVLRPLAAALIGQFRSFWLTLAGALAIGVGESLLGRYIENRGILGPLVSSDGKLLGQFPPHLVSRSAAFLVIVIVLVLRGRALPTRGDLLHRLPALGTGRIHWPFLVVATGVVGVTVAKGSDAWVVALTVTAAMAIVVLSVVVVTGFVGQLSLAQMALAGFGVWVASRLNAAWGWPLYLAALAGVLLTIAAGVIVAIPALRTRGANLAVLTLGLSVLVVDLILDNPNLNGGLNGTVIDKPKAFGIPFDGFSNPRRYVAVTIAVLLLTGLAVANVRRGRTGRRMIAVRDNERAAAALGIHVSGVKTYAFGLGGALAAVGGILLAFRQEFIDYSTFGSIASIEIIVYAVIGGIGFVSGAPIAGVMALGGIGGHFFTWFGLDANDIDWISALVLIVNLFQSPNGVAYENARVARAMRRRLRRAQVSSTTTGPLPGDAPLAAIVKGVPLEITEMTVRFGGVVALDGVSLTVRPGEVLGLIGPNGAGKTTFVDAVTGFVPSAGSVQLDGVEMQRWSVARRALAGLGRSFQSLELFEDLTVRENLLAACDDRGRQHYLLDLLRPRLAPLSPAAVAAVHEFQLEDVLDRLPSELPDGRRRLVAVARAVAASPRVLLLDEPAAGLSDVESRELGTLLTNLAHRSGLSVLMIEHDVSLVMSVSDRVAVLDFGRLIAEGTPAEVASDPMVIAAYLGDTDDEHVEVPSA